MSKLPDDAITAYDFVKDALGAAISVCVSVLNEERAKKLPDQDTLTKYEKILEKADDLRDDIPIDRPERMQEIYDEYNQFVRSHRGL